MIQILDQPVVLNLRHMFWLLLNQWIVRKQISEWVGGFWDHVLNKDPICWININAQIYFQDGLN